MVQQPPEVRDYVQVKLDVLKDFGIVPEPAELQKLAGCTTFSSMDYEMKTIIKRHWHMPFLVKIQVFFGFCPCKNLAIYYN